MKITLLTVGKIKEKYLRDAISEYEKRLSKYCRLETVQVKDERDDDKANARQAISKEAARLLAQLKDDSYIIALAINGTRLSSERFAETIDALGQKGISHITFIIGGSCGLSEQVLEKADLLLSFSDMTFPHQLMRVILLEQLYRAYKIISGEPYHK